VINLRWIEGKMGQELERQVSLLSAMVEGISDTVFVKDVEGRYLFINAAGAQAVGKPAAEIVGQDDYRFFPGETADRLAQIDRDVISRRESIESEIDVEIGGERRTFLSTKSPFLDESGDIVGVIGIARDITGKKLAEAELARLTAEQALILDNAPVGIAYLKDRNFHHLNRRFAAIFGYQPDELLNLSTEIVYSSREEFERVGWDAYGKHVRDGTYFEERLMKSKTDEALWIGSTGFLLDPEERIFIWCVEDIGERKRAEEEVRLSEARYRDIAECSADWFFEQDAEGMLTHLSDNFEKVTGIRAEDLIGKSATDLIDLDSFDDRMKETAAAVTQRQPFRDAEFVLRVPDGREPWLRSSGNPIFADDGTFMGYRGATTDISERKRAEENLVAAADIVRTISSGLFTYQFHPPDRLVLLDGNPASERLTNIRIDDWRGREFDEIWPEAREIGVTQAFIDVMTTGKAFHTEDLSYKDDKLEGAFLINAFKIPGERLCVAFENIFDRKRAQEALERAKEQAEMANAAKSIFLANMSHELRTPLNSINGFAEMMAGEVMGPLPPRYLEYADHIHKSGTHLLKVISDVLDMSKIEAGRIELSPEKADINGIVDETISMLADQFAEAEVSLKRAGNSPCAVIVDPLRIKQVLLNVLSNAAKFSPGGTVTVSISCDDATGRIVVSDTGIGMTDENIEIALTPFGQAEAQAFTRRFEGTGLGLPLAKQLIELHGGTLTIESKPSKGTTVAVNLPR
jgi:PAS domain S-box-containing protein